MDIRYVKGSENIVADTLSRIEIETLYHTNDLTSLIGINRIRTTAYNPAANGLVERLHRQIKVAIMASGNTINWIDALPLVLLGIRSSIKEVLKFTTAEMGFGTTLNLPPDLLTNSEFKNPDPSNFATQLKIYITERTSQRWFALWFKSDNFDLEEEERPGASPKIVDKYLEARLDEDPTQTQKEPSKTLGITQPAIFYRLKEIGMIRMVGNWAPYELKPRDVERRFFTGEQLLQRQKRKGFLHRIVDGDERWVQYDYPKRRKTYG
ncbi:CNOT6L [Cordylochernes scorpioides]|uniref:CNOT6L n=1 Tax=Cordylochernes scorpioides TaxID=51811 RepID=A0ABY6KH63_9ARAC|nr:CNOT6L [Cordylochernes scorpioides]